MNAVKKGKIIVCSAPSGAGKSTLLTHLMEVVPNLTYSVSATTRAPRGKEVNGKDYYFMSVDEFKQKIENNEFAEWKIVHGNYYGTPKKSIDDNLKKGLSVVLDIDVKGKKMLDESYDDAVGILVLPPSLKVLEERLRSRNTDSEEDIAIRLGNAEDEIKFAQTHGEYKYSIINDDLEKAQKDMVSIVREIIKD